jgi:hypothetical protein
MADPNSSYGNRRVPTHGVGPYEFQVPDLDPGDTHIIDLREKEENGTKGYYTVLSEAGYDVVEIGNQTSQRLTATLNEVNNYPVFSNSVRGIDHEGTYRIEVKNNGTGTASNVTVTIEQSGYNSDQQAKDERSKSPFAKVINHFTGLG